MRIMRVPKIVQKIRRKCQEKLLFTLQTPSTHLAGPLYLRRADSIGL